MKVILIGYYYHEITPRAFRLKSLYDGLTSMGCDVELITPSKKKPKQVSARGSASRIKTVLRRIVEKTLPGGKDLKSVPFFLKSLRNKEADLILSVGLPFSVHLMVACSVRFFGLKSKSIIFDYGDPYSENPSGNYCFYARPLEKWVLKYCDQILVPINEAVSLFDKVKSDKCGINVIPQGYKIQDVRVSLYERTSTPTFCYAGIFYKGIREPLSFLHYISHIETDYKFVIYTNVDSEENLSIIRKYSKGMGSRLVIKPLIPREECIFELSKMDFLVNFSNANGVQLPSKLVDYTLSKRPFLTIANEQDTFAEFESYLARNYETFKSMDISAYDQRVVARNIIKLSKVLINDAI